DRVYIFHDPVVPLSSIYPYGNPSSDLQMLQEAKEPFARIGQMVQDAYAVYEIERFFEWQLINVRLDDMNIGKIAGVLKGDVHRFGQINTDYITCAEAS